MRANGRSKRSESQCRRLGVLGCGWSSFVLNSLTGDQESEYTHLESNLIVYNEYRSILVL
eukprot:10247268-Karenia_brevis.AAC.1